MNPFLRGGVAMAFGLGLAAALGGVSQARAQAEEETTELGDRMDRMNQAFRLLKKQIADPTQNAASLKLVATLREHSQASLDLVPAKAADLPENERAKFTLQYKEKMKEFAGALDALEAALKANDNVAAAKGLQELNTLQRAGHKDFRKPMD